MARLTTAIAPATVFVPIHWGALWAAQADANTLTHATLCPDSLQPELKACAVQLIPMKTDPSTSSVYSDMNQHHSSHIYLVQR